MTLLGNLDASTSKAVIVTADSLTGQLPAPPDDAHAELHNHFADRADELHQSLRAVRAEFEALLDERLVGAEEFRRLGEAAHMYAEEVDALLGLLVRCKASEALIQSAEATFDALRDLEEQITELLDWNDGMGRRLDVLGKSSHGQRPTW